MPYTFSIDTSLKRVIFCAEEELSTDEFLNCLNEVVEHPSFGKDFDHLVDLRNATRVITNASSMLRRVDSDIALADRLGRGRCALISSSPVIWGITRIYKILMRDGPLEVELFKDPDNACKWLDQTRSGEHSR
jgi:hypothetical protein